MDSETHTLSGKEKINIALLSAEIFGLRIANKALRGARRFFRNLEGLEKLHAKHEIEHYREMINPSASYLEVYRFAKTNPREMQRIARTTLCDIEQEDEPWSPRWYSQPSALVRRANNIASRRISTRLSAA